ncbi:helix-turn-helix domain-containing protein [Mycobacterium sp. BK086]|uniref:helix-turn-helix domain-containing protein n=1 Tax=Mycobacterium sp. BK086 TaxID=2512165 RepID=UPI001414E976
MRAEVVAAYEAGHATQDVAERFAIARTTVLKILKQAGVPVRRQSRQYWQHRPSGTFDCPAC